MVVAQTMTSMLTTALSNNTQPVSRLRILATTDLHGHLLPYDYIKDQPTQGGGLAGLSCLINEARAQAEIAQTPVLLLDNGDTFQGTPLADYLAEHKVRPDHPIIASLNYLKYDALGLGNHDLDHGLPYLKKVTQALDMPMLNSNLMNVEANPLHRSLLIPIAMGPDAPAPLTVGLLSVLPSQTTASHSHQLGSAAFFEEPADSIPAAAQELRKAGADLVIVLGHLGVGLVDDPDLNAQAAHALTHSNDIDALILGHTHRRLPSFDYASRKDVDIWLSTIGGVPAILAGHAGSDLGVMDLELTHDAALGWSINQHVCTLRPNDANVLPDHAIITISENAHETVRSHLKQLIATNSRDTHSYFSLISPAPTQRVTAHAQYHMIRNVLENSPHAAIPLLSTAAALSAGGRGGLGNYIHVPKGPILRRHIAGLNPFADHTVGIQVTGSQLHDWLEHSALLFNTLDEGNTAQMLVNPDIPAFQFDTIFGLEYMINLAAPRYARISGLKYAGTPVEPRQEFILATSQFRAAGGGGYAPTKTENVLATCVTPLQGSMIEIAQTSAVDPWGEATPWRFAPFNGARAILLTHPDALNHLEEIAYFTPSLAGTTPDGFIQLSISL
jgi:2',3'-cyclic-nucleotide 2'-phosphodiesterase/3'-nucleotidase